jgi:thioredoxin 1
MNRNLKFSLALGILLIALSSRHAWGQSHASDYPVSAGDFAPLQQWKSAVIAGDASALKALYSVEPAADVTADGAKSDTDGDVNFWLGLKARSVKLEIVRSKTRPDARSFIFHADVENKKNGQITTVIDAVAWQKQGEQWRIRDVERTDTPHLKQPADMKKDIYPANLDAHAEIKEAEEKAAPAHKRLLLVFGANWCYDCHVLDLAFQRADTAPILKAGYEIVHIDLGDDEKKNADLVKQYDIPLNKGVPAVAVADSDGKLVVSQKNGEFEDARSLTPETLVAFLNKWKPDSQ